MYKTKNILKFAVSMLFVVATFTACVKDSDFETPQIQYEDNDISNSTISAVKNNIIQNYNNATNPGAAQLIYTFPDDSPVVISGYVVSNDKDGNFYKKLVIQDNFENPTSGIEIDIDLRSIYTKYNFGRKIYIKMAGLSVTYLDGQQENSPPYLNTSNPTDNIPGVYKIGIRDVDFKLKRISGTKADEIITRSGITKEIVPQIITTSDINDDTMNTYVQMNDVQFTNDELGKTYAGEPNDQYDAERLLLDCFTFETVKFLTSTFSPFKSTLLPQGKGNLEAVLMKNFREASPALVPSWYNKINLTDTDNRCRLEFCSPDCVDTFDNGLIKWDAYSITGAQEWEIANYGNPAPSAKISGYSGGPQDNEDWLISKPIDLSSATTATLSFDNVKRYNGPDFELYISTDYTGGDPTSNGTWTQLNGFTIDTDTGSWNSWTNSGNIDVSSAVGGDLYVAFKYISSTGSGSATFEIDNVSITY